MSLSLIVAMTKNRVIGKDNQMPWHLPADLAWFRQNTTGKPVIMGRKTFESIGRPLPKRTNIVLSRQPFEHDGVIWKDSLESAVDFVRDSEEIMLIGGGQLFNEYVSKADRLYLTEIQTELDGDTFFPSINWDEWHIEFEQYRSADEQNPYDCRFLILLKKK
ncbi:type 3 dihydrofolate reductase [Aggregatibacter aphrophilus]|jgi:dihydrofolate reductase|uniref:Dihydrofolate reductase n=2 Tax=Aggregatibacter aphrophilus TaxID=732 RepID=A0A336N356_AGGAP|nr:type 3 dihydrofolate reductase [Aggregatibacter aphrophilus]KNE84557.1 dihydrofolate reductase [Aggregatibacter aphrophilus ATCC 33389]MDU7785264.1 type 3 dihydrofolate reductase [Aggregatibacter aphrophilus]OBY54708.1 dihydrofolate reductase [Aggregatibacter aphrophilus]RDE86289.1 type 3 dihydrofolate reductase [Aggregatibacter aphrophilus]SSY94041.1 Dihydrofolate reductase [Aggregatibacter aphrophilus]